MKLGIPFILLLILLALGSTASLQAQGGRYVNPQILPDGTYVPGYYPDGRNVFFNNPTPRNFTDPYTGQRRPSLPYSNVNVDQDSSYFLGHTYNMMYDYQGQP